MMKKNYEVSVTWLMSGTLTVEAETPEEALKVAEAESRNCPLPTNGEYVDGSFEVDLDAEPWLV